MAALSFSPSVVPDSSIACLRICTASYDWVQKLLTRKSAPSVSAKNWATSTVLVLVSVVPASPTRPSRAPGWAWAQADGSELSRSSVNRGTPGSCWCSVFWARTSKLAFWVATRTASGPAFLILATSALRSVASMAPLTTSRSTQSRLSMRPLLNCTWEGELSWRKATFLAPSESKAAQ